MPKSPSGRCYPINFLLQRSSINAKGMKQNTHILSVTAEYLSWHRSLLRKVRQLAFGHFSITVLLFIIAQFSVVLAFFLPVKVIFMAASGGISRYMRSFVTPDNKEMAMVLIAIASVCFYLLYLAADYFANKISQKAATKLLSKTEKLALFRDEDKIAKNFFLKFCRSMGSMVIVVAGFMLGMYFSTFLFTALFIVILVEYTGIGVYWQLLQKTGSVEAQVQFVENQPRLLRYLSNLNFFVGFALLLYVFTYDDTFGLLVGILSFILFRQIMQQLFSAVRDMLFLHKNKPKIDALFYTNIHYAPPISQKDNRFIEAISVEQRQTWIKKVLKNNNLVIESEWEWIDIIGKNIALFKAIGHNGKGETFFVKIYNNDKSLLYNQEKIIFSAFSSDTSVMPTLISSHHYHGCNILFFKDRNVNKPDKKDMKSAIRDAENAILALEPDTSLISRSLRAKPSLPERLTKEKISRLYVAANPGQETFDLNKLLEKYATLKKELSTIPLAVRNPDLKSANMMLGTDGKPMVMVWSKWSLDPIGAGLSPKRNNAEIQEILDNEKTRRTDIDDVTPNMLRLANFAERLESAVDRQKYQEGIELVPELLFCLNNKKSIDGDPQYQSL